MAKAPAVKPKSSFADWFRRAPKAKAAARPGTSPTSSTLTNIPVAAGPATKPGRDARAAGASEAQEQAHLAAAHSAIPSLSGRALTQHKSLRRVLAAAPVCRICPALV